MMTEASLKTGPRRVTARVTTALAALLVAATAMSVASGSALAGRAAYGLNPRFVGSSDHGGAPLEMSRELEAATTYMTAAEMQETIAGLTGFSHPAFERYADVIGRYDPVTGRRTADRPSLVSVLFMQQIALSIADFVVEREMFLDDDERLVFSRIDLAASPDDAALQTFVDALHTRWLGQPPGAPTMAVMTRNFRAVETAQGVPAAYGRVLALLLQHGGLYFY
jgi:hypothetical protein